MSRSHNKLRTMCLTVLIAGHFSEVRSQSTSEMVSIPAGAFMMGTDTGSPDERPAHIVELSSFLLDRTPVTKAQFALFLEAEGPVSPRGETYYEDDDSDARIHQRGGSWVVDSGLENHPVLEVSWVGARDYCAWANKRLPTEAEWEKAARGTDGRRYPWGNQTPDRNRRSSAEAGTRRHRSGAFLMVPALTGSWTWPVTLGSGSAAPTRPTSMTPLTVARTWNRDLFGERGGAARIRQRRQSGRPNGAGIFHARSVPATITSASVAPCSTASTIPEA